MAQQTNSRTEVDAAVRAMCGAVRAAMASCDDFSRAWYRARPGETTREARDRHQTNLVAELVGHPVKRMTFPAQDDR